MDRRTLLCQRMGQDAILMKFNGTGQCGAVDYPCRIQVESNMGRPALFVVLVTASAGVFKASRGLNMSRGCSTIRLFYSRHINVLRSGYLIW